MAGRGFGIGRPGQFAEFRRHSIQRMEQASLKATDQAARAAAAQIKAAMPGRLGGAITSGSDLRKGRGVHRRGAEGYRASGWVAIRGKSERTVGAVISATEGAEIRPIKGPFLWIATDEIPRRAGRYRMTPALYRRSGLENRIGPLVQIPGRHRGEALLIVRSVTVDRFGRRGRARRLPRRGAIGGSRERRDFIVAFVGIRNTSRSASVDARQIISLEQARLSEYRIAAMARDGFER
ncbi:MAG: hypothetical protein QOH47_2416 [Sphingomonadales bacterium]|jgi:hypothetical protein|nr:hypothetical protein [Sphingomonadales bacterium]